MISAWAEAHDSRPAFRPSTATSFPAPVMGWSLPARSLPSETWTGGRPGPPGVSGLTYARSSARGRSNPERSSHGAHRRARPCPDRSGPAADRRPWPSTRSRSLRPGGSSLAATSTGPTGDRHLAGALPAAITDRFLTLGWVSRTAGRGLRASRLRPATGPRRNRSAVGRVTFPVEDPCPDDAPLLDSGAVVGRARLPHAEDPTVLKWSVAAPGARGCPACTRGSKLPRSRGGLGPRLGCTDRSGRGPRRALVGEDTETRLQSLRGEVHSLAQLGGPVRGNVQVEPAELRRVEDTEREVDQVRVRLGDQL